MNRIKFGEIMRNDDFVGWEGDNALQGLKIIEKYLPGKGIDGADHDIIYSVGVDELIDAGITYEDVKKLRNLNWIISDEYMACNV